jgi:hypothetical protein
MTNAAFIKKIELIGFKKMDVSYYPTYSLKARLSNTFIYVDHNDTIPITMWKVLSDDEVIWDKNDGPAKRLSYEDCLKELK